MFRNCMKAASSSYAKYAFANGPAVLSMNVNYHGPGYLWIQHAGVTSASDISRPSKSRKSVTQLASEQLEKMKTDPEIVNRMKVLELEMNITRNSGNNVPEKLTDKQWIDLLSARSRSSRRRLLAFFWKTEMAIKKQKRTKEMKKLKEEDRLEEINSQGALSYGLGHNSMFLRIYKKTMNEFYASRILNALMYGSTVVFDFAYSQYMSPQEICTCARQIVLSLVNNRVHDYPFYLSLTNVQQSDRLFEKLLQYVPTLQDDDFPITITSEPATSLYNPQRLVYLTPDSQNVLNYDANDTYVVGSFVDKRIQKPLSLERARSLGIRHARLPLEIMEFGDYSSKVLTIDQTLNILLDVNHTGDWVKAFKHVPSRKLKHASQMRQNHKLALHNFSFYTNMDKPKPNTYDDYKY